MLPRAINLINKNKACKKHEFKKIQRIGSNDNKNSKRIENPN